MKVLVVHDRYRSAQPSGENTVVEDEVSLLREHGCDVRLLDVSNDEIASWSPAKRAGLPVRVVWSREGYRLLRLRAASFGPDVVHIHNTFPLLSPSALWAARRSGAAVVQTLHNFRPICPAATFLREGRICEACLGRLPWPSLRYGCYRGSRLATVPIAAANTFHHLLGTWARCVDTFIAPSQFTRRKFVDAGWPREKIEVKYNTARDAGLRRAGNGEGFVCLSRLGPEKGIDVLLAAWARAFPDGDERLTLIGSGPSEAALRTQAAGMKGVEFRGRLDRPDAMRLLGRARAVIVPSRCYEGLPRVVVEAYALGVPVVASRLGALGEVVVHGDTGLLVEPQTPADLGGALRRLAGSAELSARLGSGARRAYETRFSPRVTMRALLEVYGRAACSARTSRAATAERYAGVGTP